MKAAVIIGGGPAGCQCALWLHMLGYDVLIVEKSKQLDCLQLEENKLVINGEESCEIFN